MVRLQIQLELAQHRLVKKRARQLGVSASEVIRRCVAAQIDGDSADAHAERISRARAVAGRYADPVGATDTARRHDAALAETFRR